MLMNAPESGRLHLTSTVSESGFTWTQILYAIALPLYADLRIMELPQETATPRHFLEVPDVQASAHRLVLTFSTNPKTAENLAPKTRADMPTPDKEALCG